jgi:Domain of unknown function (DUF4157)
VSKQRTHAGLRSKKADPKRPVSKPGDHHEREAERAAEVVARGGSVSSWAFSSVPASAPDPVQRQEVVKEKTNEEKKQEAIKKTSEAALATPQGQAVKEAVLNDPLVKKAKDVVTSTPGLIATGAAAAGGVAALAATGKELPFQPPEIPLDKISKKFEGASAQITYEGPVNKPTFVGLTLTFKEQGPKAKKDKPDAIAAETARLKAQQEMLKPESQKAAEKKEADEWVQAWVAQQKFPGAPSGVTIPLLEPKPGEKKEEKKEEEKKPAQPAPASPSSAPPAHAEVDGALSTLGRPLDPSTRRAMEARFGYDFSNVRVHDDARASETAAEIDAAAFTVGEDVVFGIGRYDPSSPVGRQLLAHELAHVVQQAGRRGGAGGPLIQRRSIFESLGILLGIEEGTWSDRELRDYLTLIGSTGKIEGDYDSDNKARAIVRRWKAAAPGWDLQPGEKVLLIREMLDGPTTGVDEECILDLLELSDASDLRAILGPAGVALTNLESDIDGDNRKRLDTFVAGRFKGGRDALVAGRVEVTGPPLPAGAPAYDFDQAALDTRFDSDRTAEELVPIIRAYSPAGRGRALHYLSQVRRPKLQEVVERLAVQLGKETDKARVKDLRAQFDRAQAAQLKAERVLLHFFLDARPATAADLAGGTVPADPARRQELKDVLHPPVHQTPTGTAAKFRRKLPGEKLNYDEKAKALLPPLVNGYHDDIVGTRGPTEHKTAGLVHELSEFEAIGNVSKAETDAVFRRYLPKDMPPLTADKPATPGHKEVRGNIHDRFSEAEKDVRRDPSLKRVFARNMLIYFFQSDGEIRKLNGAHDATPDFPAPRFLPQNPEAILLNNVAEQFLATPANVQALFEIERNWPAEQQTPDIFIQIFRGGTPEQDRLLLWDMFQTLIHEYIHSLKADAYQKYADKLPAASFNTLIEGVCSLFTEIVWTNVEPRVGTKELRRKIEGNTIADNEPAIRVPHASQRRYESYTEALALVDKVGIEALYAAYFLGLVDRIGGPAPTGTAHGGGHP